MPGRAGPGLVPNRRNTGIPTASTTSWGARIGAICAAKAGSGPLQRGWSVGSGTEAAMGSPWTGAPRRSARAARAAPASRPATASPARITGLRAPSRSAAARSSASAGGGAPARGGAGTCGGRRRGHLDVEREREHHRPARRRRSPCAPPGRRPRAGRPAAQPPTPPWPAAGRARPAPRRGRAPAGSRLCTCWPTVTTRGTRQRAAFRIPDIALARPGWTCTLTAAGRPVTRAWPSAMPMTTASWSPST